MGRRVEVNVVIGIAINNGLSMIDELKKYITAIVDDRSRMETVGEAWLTNYDRLCNKILTCDPNDFLNWDVILRTMVVGNAEFIRDELNYLKDLPDWKSRWEKALEESPIGNPTLYHYFPSSSGNLIHQAYHLAQFENKTGMNISQANIVFEFGGGYGSMCRLVHNLNFKGRYIIYDLPPFSALQRYFLKMNGISAVTSSAYFEKTSNRVVCVSELKQLEAILADHANIGDDVFIANWSLSESPVNLRHSILSIVKPFKAFLFAYQGRFDEIDNVGFFKEWVNTMVDIKWYNWKIPHLPNQLYRDNYYLMGMKI
jgi:hypothetical protein